MINVQDIRKGMVFKYEGNIWTVMTMQHVTPGKGGAFVKLKARSQKSGNAKEMTFRSGEKIDNVNVYEKNVTYLYKENDNYVFMDNENYEQYHVSSDLCEDIEKFVVLNAELSVNILENNVLSVNPPNFVNLKVIHSEPGVRGDTATKALKVVEVETGYRLSVPLFVNEGDILKIDTRSGEYLERIKN